MRFAEEIVLLALDDDTGRFHRLPERALECAVAGAVLFELAFARRIDNDQTHLRVVDPRPAGDLLVDQICLSLAAHPDGLTIAQALALAALRAADLVESLLDDMVNRKILEARGGPYSAAGSERLFPKVRRDGVTGIRRRIRTAILTETTPDPSDVVVICLMDACRLTRCVFTDEELARCRPRIELLANLEFIGRGIASAIRTFEHASFEETAGPVLGLRLDAPASFAGGPAAVASAMGRIYAESGVKRGAIVLTNVNQADGFDCPACAWPEPAHRNVFEFCENGAKAIASETTQKTVDPGFFGRWQVEDLALLSEYWLEQQGRLVHPMILESGASHYAPISWDDALGVIASELASLPSPDQAVFYACGRVSNEAAFLYQLFARQLGTNNLPSSANLCHEPSAVALTRSLGFPKGGVDLDDFERADAIFVFGHNPGSNHPRMLTTLQRAVRAGCRIVAVNPLPEAGLMGFSNPQEIRSFLGGSTPLASLFLQVRIDGDRALLKGMQKALLEAEARDPGRVLDLAFIERYTTGFEALAASLHETSWDAIVEQSGLARSKIEEAARVYAGARRVISAWCLGLTQHLGAVATIQELVNLMLLRGNVGREGTGLLPVRGHSNIQGIRTMGIGNRTSDSFLRSLGREFRFAPPRGPGLDTVEAIRAMHDGRCSVLVSLGGNLASSGPDTAYTMEAIRRCRLTVQISTKLNRSHLVTGSRAIILPCLGRTEIDLQQGGPQFTTVENAVGRVHRTRGCLEPGSPHLRSDVRIVADLAARALGSRSAVPWTELAANYDRIRDSISRVVPGFKGFNRRVREKRGFALPNPLRERQFRTASRRAAFAPHPLDPILLEPGQLLLMTIRSHDQFNTTIHGMNDRYRGIRDERRVVFVNPIDLQAFALRPGQLVDLVGAARDRPRVATRFRVVPYDIPQGCAAAYFPETNVLVPVHSAGTGSGTPASKSVVITLRASGE